MDKQQFSVFASALRTFYSKENLLPNGQAMELWYRQLKDIPYEVAEAALNKWVATHKWSPSIAEIRELTTDICLGDIPEWGEGWRQVCVAIEKYGREYPKSSYQSMDAITAEAAKQLGAWWNVCTSENVDVLRSNFRTNYEAIAKRKREERQTSAELQGTIKRLLSNGEDKPLLSATEL